MQEPKSYPEKCNVQGPTMSVPENIRKVGARRIAEIGAYKGDTTKLILSEVREISYLHIFDFHDRVKEILQSINQEDRIKVKGFGSSRRFSDSYCWSLLKMLSSHERPYDFVFFDGAHTFDVDGLALFLVDQLLEPGGYIELDDYDWSLQESPTLNPEVFPLTAIKYTEEQIKFKTVAFLAENLLVSRLGYQEITPKRLYRKPGEVT